jgi:hypothetical protein
VRVLVLAAGLLALSACRREKTYTTTVEVLHVQPVVLSPSASALLDVEVRYADCPGDARRSMRLDPAFAKCGKDVKKGDKLEMEIRHHYVSDRGNYRAEVRRLGNCPVKLDTKEGANFESVQVCSDVTATGAVIGVHCDRRGTSKDLLEKCPFMLR